MLTYRTKVSPDSERPQEQPEDDDDGLLEARIGTVAARRPFTDVVTDRIARKHIRSIIQL